VLPDLGALDPLLAELPPEFQRLLVGADPVAGLDTLVSAMP